MVGTLEIRKRGRRPAVGMFGAIVRDVQFWIPVAVLLGGLVVLTWIR